MKKKLSSEKNNTFGQTQACLASWNEQSVLSVRLERLESNTGHDVDKSHFKIAGDSVVVICFSDNSMISGKP